MAPRFLMVGDVHLSDRPPTTRVEGYSDQVLTKLAEIRDLADEHDVAAVFYVGDIFHSKIPRNTSFRLVSALGEIWREQRPTYVVPGNHDYAAQNVETLRNHPLHQMSHLPNVTLFGFGDQRQVVSEGITFQGVREEEPPRAFLGDYDVAVAHSPIFPPGKGPKEWEHIDAYHLAQLFENQGPEVIWYGHIHTPHGHYEVGGTHFVNLGAIARGSLHEGKHDRIPEVGLLEIPYRMQPLTLYTALEASEVFRYAEVGEAAEEAASAQEFAESLSQVRLEVFSIEALVERLRTNTDVPRHVTQRAVDLVLEAAEK